MSLDIQIDLVGLQGLNAGKPTNDELSLISSMLPELLLLVQQLDDSDED